MTKIIFTFFITIAVSAGAQTEFRGSPKAVACAQYLNNILPEVVTGSPLVAHVGSFRELPLLMQQSGTSPESILISVVLFSKLLSTAPNGHIINEVYTRLIKSQDDANSLLMCVTAQQCRPKFGQAIHVASQTNFDIVPFEIGKEPTPWGRLMRTLRKDEKPGWYLGTIFTKPAHRAIVVKGGNNIGSLDWVGGLIHEATHAADFEIVSDWIQANIKLQGRGKEPDNLFKTFVRVSKEKPEINEGFMRVLIESRAYMAEAEGITALTPPEFTSQGMKFYRVQVMKDFKDFSKVTSPVMDYFGGIHKDNVFEIATMLSQRINLTIQQATALK
jgi:hypothetical protein